MIGAGFGGLAVARNLLGTPVVRPADRRQQLPHVPAAAVPGGDGRAGRRRRVAAGAGHRPPRPSTPATGNVRFRMGRAVAVDARPPDRRTLEGGDTVDYDWLVVAVGAVPHDFDVQGVDDHTLVLKHLDDALSIRGPPARRLRASGDRAVADRRRCPRRGRSVGGGATGVEMAGAMRELYVHVMAKDFPDLPGRVGPDRARRAGRPPAVAVPPSARRSGLGAPCDGAASRCCLGVGVAAVTSGPGRADRRHGAQGRHDDLVDRRDGRAAGRHARHADRPRRAARRRARPQRAGPPRGVRHRRRRRHARPPTARRSRRSPARRSRAASTSPARSCGGSTVGRRRRSAISDKGQMATIGRHDAVTELPNGIAPRRPARVAVVARPAPRVPDRVPQPPERVRQLVLELPDVRPREPHPARIRAARVARVRQTGKMRS